MLKRTFFPRGYVSGQKVPGGTTDGCVDFVEHGDPEVRALAKMLMAEQGIHGWENEKRVLNAAVRLFGEDIGDWFILQNTNGCFVDAKGDTLKYNVAFLQDTFDFLFRDTLRSASTVNWLDLMTDATPTTTVNVHKDHGLSLKPPAYIRKDWRRCFLARWLAKPNGMTDLVMSLYILFGAPTAGIREFQVTKNT